MEQEVESQEEVMNKVIDWEELTKELDRLLQKKGSNQQITGWIQVSHSTAEHLYSDGQSTMNVKLRYHGEKLLEQKSHKQILLYKIFKYLMFNILLIEAQILGSSSSPTRVE